MANIGNLETIIKISRENYEILINGGTVGGYSYDPEAMYLEMVLYTVQMKLVIMLLTLS